MATTRKILTATTYEELIAAKEARAAAMGQKTDNNTDWTDSDPEETLETTTGDTNASMELDEDEDVEDHEVRKRSVEGKGRYRNVKSGERPVSLLRKRPLAGFNPENMTLDEVAAAYTERSNQTSVDPGSATFKKPRTNFERMDTEDYGQDVVDRALRPPVVDEATAAKRENKPKFLVPDVPRRKISLASTSSSVSDDRSASLTLDEMIQRRKQVVQFAQQIDPATSSLEDIIRNIQANQKPPMSFRRGRPSEEERALIYGMNKEKYGSSGDGKSFGFGFRFTGGSNDNISTNSSNTSKFSSVSGKRRFWFPTDREVDDWTTWQEERDTEPYNQRQMLQRDVVFKPDYILNLLNQDGFDMEIEGLEIEENAPISDEERRAKRWRIEYAIEDLKDGKKYSGVGIGPRKELAKQLAAFDAVRKIKEPNPSMRIPMCQITLADRVSPWLIHLVEQECRQKNMSCSYDLMTEFDKNKVTHLKWTGIYNCDGVLSYGYSVRSAEDAKKMAARAAYEVISGVPIPFDPLLFGEACGDATFYKYAWSEAHHVYVIETEDNPDAP